MNPFSSRAIRPDGNVYRFHTESIRDQELRQRFIADLIETLRMHRLASVIGPHGTGKTTLLRSVEPALREHFTNVSWTTLSTEKRARWYDVFPTSRHASACGPTAADAATDARRFTPGGSPSGCCIVVDGFEQLSWWDRMLLIWHIKRSGTISLIVTSHRPVGPIPVCHRTGWNIAMTRLLAAEKLADVDEPTRAKMWSKLENRLAISKKEAANVRDLWFAMYDEFETIRQQEPLKS